MVIVVVVVVVVIVMSRLVQLAKGLDIAFNWSVVLSVGEFSHEGSFLHQVKFGDLNNR